MTGYKYQKYYWYFARWKILIIRHNDLKLVYVTILSGEICQKNNSFQKIFNYWLETSWLVPGWPVTGDWWLVDWCLVDWCLVDWWLVKLIDWCLVDWWLVTVDRWLVTGGLRLYRILSTQRCHLDGSYPGSIAIWGGAPISKELSYNPSRVDKFFTISFSTMRIFSQLKISANKSPGKTYRKCWITWNEKNKNILHI